MQFELEMRTVTMIGAGAGSNSTEDEDLEFLAAGRAVVTTSRFGVEDDPAVEDYFANFNMD